LTIVGPLQNLAGGTLTGGTWHVGNGIVQFPANISSNAADITIAGVTAHLENGAGTNAIEGLKVNLAGGTLTLGPGRLLALTRSFTNAGTIDVVNSATFSDLGAFTHTAGALMV